MENLQHLFSFNELLMTFSTFLLIFQYHGQNQTYERVLRYINMLFTGLFTIEAMLKIFGFGLKVSHCATRIKVKVA